jgi:hypothetical protein
MRPPTAPLEGRMISSPKSKARRPCTLAQQHMLAADSPTVESQQISFITVSANVVRVKYFMPNA